MLGDITAGPAYRFAQWLELVRKRSGKYRASGFPHRPYRLETMPSSWGESLVDSKSPPPEQASEISLWDALDIELSSFSWDMLSSLHHTEHSSSNENSEDEMSKALEVTVNSGGVVFFALFHQPGNVDAFHKEAAAVIKFSSSRMATQSERLGYEFAKWLGVQTPQARVIHNCSSEWLQIKEAGEKARVAAALEGDEAGEVTCSELLEALELSRCLLLLRDDLVVPESPSHGIVHCPSPPRNKESSDSSSHMSRESWHGKFSKGSGEPLRSMRLTTKLRDIHKFAKETHSTRSMECSKTSSSASSAQ